LERLFRSEQLVGNIRISKMTAPWRAGKKVFAVIACAMTVTGAQNGDHDGSAPEDLSASIHRIRESLFRPNDRLEAKIRRGGSFVAFVIAWKTPYVELTLDQGLGRLRIPVEGSMAVQEFRDGRWSSSESVSITTPIRGTLVSFEDMAFRFLFWPDMKKVGTAIVRTKLCSLIRFTPPANQSGYAFVEILLDKDSDIPIRVICYGADGREVKRFDPVKVHKIGDVWTVQSIRVTDAIEVRTGGWEPTYIQLEPVAGESQR
jgi:hypothetical protein